MQSTLVNRLMVLGAIFVAFDGPTEAVASPRHPAIPQSAVEAHVESQAQSPDGGLEVERCFIAEDYTFGRKAYCEANVEDIAYDKYIEYQNPFGRNLAFLVAQDRWNMNCSSRHPHVLLVGKSGSRDLLVLCFDGNVNEFTIVVSQAGTSSYAKIAFSTH